jgi:hypothetical protein
VWCILSGSNDTLVTVELGMSDIKEIDSD